MSAHKHFQAERLQALPTGPTGGHLAGSLELPRLGRTTVPRLRRGWAGQRLPLQPAAYLGCVYILTRLAEPPHPAAFPSAGWALRSLLSPQAGAPKRASVLLSWLGSTATYLWQKRLSSQLLRTARHEP